MAIKGNWLLGMVAGLGLAVPGAFGAESVKARGRVDDMKGAAVGGAEVAVVRVERVGPGGAAGFGVKEVGKVKSAGDGSFVVDWPLDQTEYSYCMLRGMAEGYAYSWARQDFEGGKPGMKWHDEQRNVDGYAPRLTLVPECFMTGKVVDGKGAGVGGVAVRVHPGRPAAVTDGEGRFKFDKLQPKNFEYLSSMYWMSFRHPEFLTKYFEPGNGSDRNVLEAGKTLDLRIELARGAVIRGRVTDADGGKVPAGFLVRAVVAAAGGGSWGYGEGAEVGADGTYQMRVAPGEARLAVIAPDGGLQGEAAEYYPVEDVVAVKTSAEAETKVDLQVKRGVALSGRVELAAAVPARVMKDLVVSIGEAQASKEVGATSRGRYMEVGSKGEFGFRGLRPVEQTLRLDLRVGGQVTVLEQTVKAPLAGELRLAPEGGKVLERMMSSVAGRVVMPDGKGAGYARLIYVPAAEATGTASWSDLAEVAGADGSFRLAVPKYLAQECRLYVRDATGVYAALVNAKATLEGGAMEIKLAEGGKARGRVVDGDGKPMAGWTVVYNRANAAWGGGGGGGPAYPRPRFAEAITDGEGKYELSGLVAGGAGDDFEVAVTMDLMITGSSMMPGAESRERGSHKGVGLGLGKVVEGLDLMVAGTERVREYRVVPRGGGGGEAGGLP